MHFLDPHVLCVILQTQMNILKHSISHSCILAADHILLKLPILHWQLIKFFVPQRGHVQVQFIQFVELNDTSYSKIISKHFN